jgi:predicted ABC-class ATPase
VNPTATKIRAEDGRAVDKVDISPFISNLPHNKSTKDFSTTNSSGSTSQAANVMEALEMGSVLMLIDEDTSATNFMIRDERMQLLVSKNCEPITPLVQRIEEMWREKNVSTILVVGGSGAYFDVAHSVCKSFRS